MAQSARDPEWKRLLAPVARARTTQAQQPSAGSEPAPLGIAFELCAEDSRGWFYESAPVPLERTQLVEGADWFVGMRPVEAGARPGTWRRGGLTWRSFAHPGTGPQRHVRALLDQLHRLSRDERNLSPGEAGMLRLDRYPSPLLWPLLERLQAAGVALTGTGLLTSVRVGGTAEKRIDLHGDAHGRLHLEPRLRIDEEEMAASGTVGDHGFAGLEGDLPRSGGALGLVLAPAVRAAAPGARALLARRAPLVVAAGERAEFEREFFPVLRSAVTVTSEDGSVDLPEEAPPLLSLLAVYGEEDEVALHWSWLYRGPEREYAVTAGPDPSRDPVAEAAVAARVSDLWPGAGEIDRQDLGGTDTAVFTVRVLPELERLDCLRVRTSGRRQDYRELTEPPRVAVTSEETGTRDWFDLAFQVTVAGRTVPFASLFRALAQGAKTLLLPDKSYLSLDHPAFDGLRRLLDEARALGEWDPEAPRISRYQVDLWEEFADAADSSEAALAWRRSVGALGRLDDVPRPAPPAGLRAELRGYQEEGYAWLSLLFDHGLGGILADDMGLGKTLQTLAMIVRARERGASASGDEAHGGSGGSARAAAAESGTAPPFLVVAPSSVVDVWAQEAARFAPDLDVRALGSSRPAAAGGGAAASGRIRARGDRGRLADRVRGADVVVTSFALLRLGAAEYAAEEWCGLVIDEAQFAKNRRTQLYGALADIRAPFRLALTGTPVENSLDDLWALLSLTAPGIFPSPVAFRQQYTLPVEKGGALHRLERVRKRIRPFVLRRTKESVAAELPARQEQVREVELLPEHRRLYDAVLQRERKKVLGMLEDLERQGMERTRFIVFRSLTLLRMLALDPSIVDGEQHGGVQSSKLHTLLEELEQVLEDRHRVLVFSQFTSFLDRVGEALTERGIDHVRLDGSTRRRGEVVAGFRNGDAGVFLLSLKAGGFGLTLTEADYVYLMDPWWNPAAEAQAVDRAHRIGQTSPVVVYRMVARGTIEEKVLELQRRKARLAESLLGGGAEPRSSEGAEDDAEDGAPAARQDGAEAGAQASSASAPEAGASARESLADFSRALSAEEMRALFA
ncbi:DEAD/DEAH box helicase [Brevibacterium album]|uniref:DEAD/DEAH box helicase n=1 Tax=Brevibacterium album TaxID=417948 RepID=UPI0012EBEEC0|nr:DEAD/DEAH box helicase [Brevibacterium album]